MPIVNGNGGSQALDTLKVSLTDAQIKTLPTTPVTLIPASAGHVVTVALLYIQKTFSAGAYTNVGTDPSTAIVFGYGTTAHVDHFCCVLAEADRSVFGVADVETYTAPLGAVEDGNGGVWPPGGIDLTGLAITTQAINSTANVPLGDFTGGNSANVLTVLVRYSVVYLT